MKKKIYLFLIGLVAALSFYLMYSISSAEEVDEKIIDIPVTHLSTEDLQRYHESYCYNKCNELLYEQIELAKIKDKKEWYIKYKEMIERYSEWADPPETIYDYYDDNEIDILFRIVEAECTGGDFINKANVASVIFNRIGDDDFGTKIHEIITEDQFTPLRDGRFYNIKVSEDTKLACEYAFAIEDTTNGALFFDSCEGSWASRNKEYLFTDSVGHNFYK